MNKTTAYSTNSCSYGTVKDSGHASAKSYYTVAFCNQSYSKISSSALINNTSKHQLDYTSKSSKACLRVSNTATAQTLQSEWCCILIQSHNQIIYSIRRVGI